MKIADTLWGIALTVMMYAILTTLGYQVITNEDLKLSIFIGTFGTFIGRFGRLKHCTIQTNQNEL